MNTNKRNYGAVFAWLCALCAAGMLFAACDTVDGTDNKQNDDGHFTETPEPGEIDRFWIGENDGIIDYPNITVVVPQETPLNALAPELTLTSPKAVASPASGTVQDFTDSISNPLVYQVSGGKTYNVTVTNAGPGSSERNITTFTITVGTTAYPATINQAAKTVSLVLPSGTPLTSLEPVIELSTGASVDPASGEACNFSASSVMPNAYTVTAENGMQTRYKVTVQTEGRIGADNPLGMTLALSPAVVSLPPATLYADVSATAGFDTYQWSIDGTELAPTGRSVTINRSDYIIGPHNLSVIAFKNSVPFNAEIIFNIEP
ncbi:MAG: DUF5018 domain-containing protein [Spirochaetaceae bacterium]|nr:DUF5018 domain-containing protein [Spirochaetaceae bacterium]